MKLIQQTDITASRFGIEKAIEMIAAGVLIRMD